MCIWCMSIENILFRVKYKVQHHNTHNTRIKIDLQV